MKTRTLPLTACLLTFALPVLAADWPQWRGPNRDDVSKETGLLKSWPKEGPKLLWTNEEMGAGYSGPSIVGDRLYCLGAGSQEYVLALDVKTGKKLWSTDFSSEIVRNRGTGPRGSPTVDGELLFAIGSQGELVCVETNTGKLRWKKSLKKDLGGQMMSGWGYSESPLVDGDRVICTPGGNQGTLAALDKQTGKVIWRSTGVTYPAGYSSVIVAEVGGVRQYIQLTGKGVIGVAAKDGKFLWESPLGGCRTAAVPTPIFHDNHVFVTSGYGDSKAGLLKLVPDGEGVKAEVVYSGRTVVNKHGGVVLLDGVLYGNSESGGPWVAIDFLTGKKLGWDSRKLGLGSLTYADGRLYLYGEDTGTVVLLEANPKEWKEAGRFKIPGESKLPRQSSKIWTHPVVANGRLYLRDQELLYCYDVSGHTTGAE